MTSIFVFILVRESISGTALRKNCVSCISHAAVFITIESRVHFRKPSHPSLISKVLQAPTLLALRSLHNKYIYQARLETLRHEHSGTIGRMGRVPMLPLLLAGLQPPLDPLQKCTHAGYQLPITKWPHQSEAPVGAAPPTRSQLRLQRQT
jgi:hypothetical protein